MSVLKKIIIICLLAIGVSCDDGDFKVVEFQFEENIQSCGEYVLYRLSREQNEALALRLTKDDFPTVEGKKTYSLDNDRRLIYRLFKSKITSNYFCQSIPPTEPVATRSLEATTATKVVITTTKDKDKQDSFEYKIVLKNVLFKDDDRFYFDEFNFGVFKK